MWSFDRLHVQIDDTIFLTNSGILTVCQWAWHTCAQTSQIVFMAAEVSRIRSVNNTCELLEQCFVHRQYMVNVWHLLDFVRTEWFIDNAPNDLQIQNMMCYNSGWTWGTCTMCTHFSIWTIIFFDSRIVNNTKMDEIFYLHHRSAFWISLFFEKLDKTKYRSLAA